MNVAELCMGCMEDRRGSATCPQCGYVENTPPSEFVHLAPRTRLGNYTIGRVLGHGGFGIVYVGWDENLELRVAIKEYLPGRYATRAPNGATVTPYSGEYRDFFEYGLTTFLDEGRAVARFNDHPGIIPVLGFVRANGTGYLVMSYVPGMTFKEYLEMKGGTIGWADAVAIAMPVLDTLRAVHQVNLLHRDISPDNIYLSQNRQVKLLDFGAARMALGDKSQSLSAILKDGYAPKEQYLSRGRQGPYTDVYALAATLYRAITGSKPPQALERLEKDDLAPPRTLGVAMSPAAEMVLLKALAVDATARYQTVQEFQEALVEAQGPTAPVLLPRPDPPPIPGPAPLRPLRLTPDPPIVLPVDPVVLPRPDPVPPRPIVLPPAVDQLAHQVSKAADAVESAAAGLLRGARPAPDQQAPWRPIGLMLAVLSGGLGTLTAMTQIPISLALGVVAFLLGCAGLVLNAVQTFGAIVSLKGDPGGTRIVWSSALLLILLTVLAMFNLAWPWIGRAGSSYVLSAVLSTAWVYAGPGLAFNGAILFCLWKRASTDSPDTPAGIS